MLKKISFCNSYSYMEEAVLNMGAKLSAIDVDENGMPLPENVVMYEVVRNRVPGAETGILPVAAIYGKNAGGKTKLLRTLSDIASDALGDSFSSVTVHSSLSPFEQIISKRQFMLVDEDKRNRTIKYAIHVVIDNVEYMLEYSLDTEGIINEKVTKRDNRANAPEDVLYYREGLNYESGDDDIIKSYLSLMKRRGETQLWFPLIAPAIGGLKSVYEWFRRVRDGMVLNHAAHEEKMFQDIASRISGNKDEPFREKLLKFLKHLDESVVDIVGKISQNNPILWVFHNNKYRVKDGGSSWAHMIEEESAGTRRLIEIFPLVDRVLEQGMPFICDELDRVLHPIVFKHLVRMFNSPEINKNNAQLIFTAHDTIVLDSNLLRRDEVHIISKNNMAVSSIERLSEMSGVDDYADMEREFRTGFYGSIPKNFSKSYGGVR